MINITLKIDEIFLDTYLKCILSNTRFFANAV